jgi:hypothetical protein
VRIDRDQQVGLLTCSSDHHAFLLDSSAYWDDVIQDSKPREKRCKCGGRAFEVDLEYELREDGDIRTITVELGCVGCQKRSLAATLEIDYSPTDTLMSRPLEPCEEPWLVPKRTEITALWVPQDLEDLVCHLGESESVRCYYAAFAEQPRLTAPAALVTTIADKPIFQLYFATREIEFPVNLNDCWKRLPVIHVPSPTRMRYETKEALFYYVHWADQFIVDRRIVPQEPELLALADRLGAWLRAHFTSARGKRAFDNHAERERLK